MEIPKEFKPLKFIYNLNDRELEIFLYLATTRERLNADELSEKLNISRTCIMSYIKKLESKGFISKVRDTRFIRKGKPQYIYFVESKKVKEKLIKKLLNYFIILGKL